MKTTGNKLRAALKYWEMKLQVLGTTFNDSTYAFQDEKKDPVGIMYRIMLAHDAIATIQTAQAKYNLEVICQVGGTTMSLCEAVKRLGMAGQVAGLWKRNLPEKGRYGYHSDRVRETTQERATSVISQEDMAQRIFDAQNYANNLQTAIATANATEIELDVPEGLFT